MIHSNAPQLIDSFLELFPGGLFFCFRQDPNAKNVVNVLSIVEYVGIEFGENPCVFILPISDGGI